MRRAIRAAVPAVAAVLALVLAPGCGGDDPAPTFCADVGLVNVGVAGDPRGALDLLIARDGLPADGWRLGESDDDGATFELDSDEPRRFDSVSVARTGPARWEAVGACMGQAGL